MRKIIAIANQKGGVGKTTTTMSLGAALAQQGKTVLLIDLDPQGNLSEYLGYDGDNLPTIAELMLSKAFGGDDLAAASIRRNPAENLCYIPASIALCNCEMQLYPCMSRESVLRRILEHPAFDIFDYILIDCQPSLGILAVNAFAAATSVLIPVQSQKFAVDGLAALLGTLQQVQQSINPNLQIEGILQTMRERTVMSAAVANLLESDYSQLLCRTSISKSTEAANSTYTKRSLVSYSNKLGKEYAQLAAELIAKEDKP